MLEHLVSIGSTLDWITPAAAYVQDLIRGPSFTFMVPHPCASHACCRSCTPLHIGTRNLSALARLRLCHRASRTCLGLRPAPLCRLSHPNAEANLRK